MGRYSQDVEEDRLISDLMRSYRHGPMPRSLCIERDWDEKQDVIRSARPYSRVRSVKVYDAQAWVAAGMPRNYEPFAAGIRMEAW